MERTQTETTRPERMSGIHVERVVTIDQPAGVVYRFWRKLENLPLVMDHIESIHEIDARRSHWVGKGPMGTRIEWNSEITEDVENERLGWRSVEGSEIDSTGLVEFTPAPGGRGTEVKVTMRYDPPGGKIGATFAKLFGHDPSQQMQEGLRRLKQLMETGEMATTEGQPSGSGKH